MEEWQEIEEAVHLQYPSSFTSLSLVHVHVPEYKLGACDTAIPCISLRLANRAYYARYLIATLSQHLNLKNKQNGETAQPTNGHDILIKSTLRLSTDAFQEPQHTIS